MRTEPVERRPAGLARTLSLAAGGVAAFLAAWAATTAAIGAGVVGAGLLTAGLVVGTRRAVTLGSVALLAGVLLSGLEGLPAGPLLLGFAATVFAWDAGGFAVDLAAQLGREAETDRLEALHCAGTAAALLGSAGLGLGVYRSASGGLPVVALLLLVVAGAVLLAAMDQA